MKYSIALILTPLCLTLFTCDVTAQIDGDENILAKRGKGVVTHDDFNARANRIPEDRRFRVLRDRGRMEDVLNNMLMLKQLAADAREAGFDQESVVQDRMALAADEELAKAWLENFTSVLNPADYSAMAREMWMVDKARYQTSNSVTVTHILIGSESRSESEALVIANRLYETLLSEPDQFDALVPEYSDDPSAASNKGTFRNVEKGDMVPSFEAKAFSMKPGEISEPVLTQYGYHLIRLDALQKARQKTFAEVRIPLEEQAREKHRERVQMIYLNEIYEPELKVTKESVENSIERVFGPEVMSKYAESPESE